MSLATGLPQTRSTRIVLDNGLVVVLLSRRHLPTVAATLLLPAGTAAEPEDRPGAAFFASQVLAVGTARHTAVQLAELVDGLGASLSASCDYDYATIDVAGLSKDAPAVLDILAEVAREAAFDAGEVERRRSQILALLERRKDDYTEVVRNRFFEEIYGAHPYHRRKEGSPESVRAITREDLLALYRSHYAPAGSILGIVGDFDAASMEAEVRRRFEDWNGSAASSASVSLPEVNEPETRRLATIRRDVTQATIRLGNVAIPRNHPDYHGAVLMNYILGGSGFGSRLMKNLREERGLTYGVHSNVWTRKGPGYFFIATQTGMSTMNEAIEEMFREVDRFLAEGPTEDEMAWAKKYFTGSLPLTLETNDQIAQKLLEQEFFGLEAEFWLRDIEKLQQTTRQDVLDVARRWIRPDRFAVVVLGNVGEGDVRLP